MSLRFIRWIVIYRLDSTVQWTLIYPGRVNLKFEQPGPESQIITGMVSVFPPILYAFF